MTTALVILTAVLAILHLPKVVAFIKKTKTQWDDRALKAAEKAKELLDPSDK